MPTNQHVVLNTVLHKMLSHIVNNIISKLRIWQPFVEITPLCKFQNVLKNNRTIRSTHDLYYSSTNASVNYIQILYSKTDELQQYTTRVV